MRQGPNNKRMRGRGNGRKHSNPRNQSFDSNGPDVKVRGNAQQIVEKYLTLARDASSSGDRIAAENYYQHAEHYYRLLNANAPAGEQRQPAGTEPDGETPRDDGEESARENAGNGSRRRNGYQAERHAADEPQPDVTSGEAAERIGDSA